MKTYWHKITVQNLIAIQTKTVKFIQNTRNRYTSTFYVFEWQEFTDQVPEILTAFDHLNLNVIQISAYMMQHCANAGPHRDPTAIPIRANIPILNTKNTWTTFWELKNKQDPTRVSTLPNGLTYIDYDYADLVQVDHCEITEATLIRPREIHSVEMAADLPTPRITLTLVLDPIPYEYFPDLERRPSDQVFAEEYDTSSEPYVRPGTVIKKI